jgi:hypothetical protein
MKEDKDGWYDLPGPASWWKNSSEQEMQQEWLDKPIQYEKNFWEAFNIAHQHKST